MFVLKLVQRRITTPDEWSTIGGPITGDPESNKLYSKSRKIRRAKDG
jgi:hypothetical protein